MQPVYHRKAITLMSTAGVLALGAAFTACSSSTNSSSESASSTTNTSSSSSSAAGGADAGTDAPTGLVGEAGAGCANPTVQIDFSPMYSAFIPGSTAQTFQIPAVTDDGNQATWSVSDPTQAVLFGQSFNGLPGVMITVQGVGTGSDGGEGSQGTLTVYAVESDGSCGSSVLTITANTEADWQTGNSRYNDGVDLTAAGAGGITRLPDGGFTLPAAAASDAGSVYERDGGTACTNCHGVTATTGPYRDVSHTPEQTGGFSDQQLIGIITQGIIPDGGYFDPSVIVPACDGGGANGGPLEPIHNDPVLRGTSADDGGSELCATFAFDTWHSFHQWSDISPDEQPGIICYLRALTPLAQNGTPGANFGRGGGMGRGDGGMRFPRDGGMPPPPDAAGEADSASAVDATTTDASESE